MSDMNQPQQKAKKMMLWVGMISMTMTFAGLTSAYVVSSARVDWLKDFQMPSIFGISTIIIVLSSILYHLAQKAIQKDQIPQAKAFILGTLALAISFIFTQFQGFNQIIESGYYFTGPQSSITTSYLYVLVLLHLFHLAAGIIVLGVSYFRVHTGRYGADRYLGMELSVLFWHFLDFLWVYLYAFVMLYG